MTSIGFTHVTVTTNQNKSFDCNRLTFINKGTQSCTITTSSDLVLDPGQSITYPAWPGEINRTIYSFTFPRDVNGCLIVAVCKNYSQ